MGSDNKALNDLTAALEGLVPAVKDLAKIDLDGALMGSLSAEDREKVEKFKKTSDVVKEAEAMAAKFNSSNWNL